MKIRIKQEIHHGEETKYEKMSKDSKKKIMDLSSCGMSSFQILTKIRNGTEKGVIYQDVYNIWASVMTEKFKRHEDPHQSSMMYIDECSSLNPPFF